ncbi:hypothetical protein ACIP98_09480 [Streptomyces sp. NPDC088354]|uniref:hypothetical protein n=1 Tax=Streptomyces sp. NPDC088354 TaxID=3365856 RepID=UPI003800E6C9
MIVCPLRHVGHQNEAGPDGATVHVDESGSLHVDEQDGDDVKLLGIYPTEQRAEERVRRAHVLPGFRGEPECSLIVPYLLDEDTRTEGFVRIPRGE